MPKLQSLLKLALIAHQREQAFNPKQMSNNITTIKTLKPIT